MSAILAHHHGSIQDGPEPASGTRIKNLLTALSWCTTILSPSMWYGAEVTRPNRRTDIADRLKGKVALVVGAGSIGPGWGNGKATAVAFAREGARVFCADINLAAAEETVGIIKGEGGEALAHRADVSKAADVAAMIEACVSAYHHIDVLDNNVGIAEVGGLVEDLGGGLGPGVRS